MTERFDGLVYLADQDIASAGATGNRTLTLTGQPFWGIFLIALKPATGTNVTARPTGNALTVSIGTVSVTAAGSASVDATGNALTVSTGNPPWPNVSASPTGNALTVSIGTATVSTPGVGGSAPAFRSFSSTIYGYVTDTIISKPTGVVDGDILIASLVMFRDGGLTATAPVVPTGWTQIGSYQNSAA